MNIIILNFTLNWVYRLYFDYIEGIIFFLENKMNHYQIKVISELFEINYIEKKDKSNVNDIDKSLLIKYSDLVEKMLIYENKYDKIILMGDIGFIDELLPIFTKHQKIYFLNIEQLSHDSYYTYFRNLPNYLQIIDYSEENIPYYQQIYKQALLFPPYFSGSLQYPKNIDILTTENNEYRKKIISTIQDYLSQNVNNHSSYVFQSLDNVYGKERDIIYNRSKIYINIHGSEKHNTMELIRIMNLLCNKVIVITQKSICSDLLFINHYLIICNKDEDLGSYVDYVLKNYDEIYHNLFIKENSFDELKYEHYIREKMKLFLENK